ncbi:uncharacterized protein M421DRAFT_27594, partial [Didymella exigua CBS 183.55]
ALPEAPWQARTPSNVRELEAQSTLIRERLKKGAEVMMLSAELMRDQITGLERANE